MHRNRKLVLAEYETALNTPARVVRAQQDALADFDGVLLPLSTAWAPDLGEYFRAALRDNRLPKTQMLFDGGWFARTGREIASSTFVHMQVFN